MTAACLACGALTTNPNKRCDEHQPIARQPHHIRAKVNAQVLKRDHGLCQIQAEGCTVLADCVDHITPLARGGTNAASNLQAACTRCNQRKGAPL